MGGSGSASRRLLINASQCSPNIVACCQQGSWRGLVAFAYTLVVDDRNSGGYWYGAASRAGMRLMLALGYRMSHDIDLFICVSVS